MSVWNRLIRLFEAADPLDRVERFVIRKYGEHEAEGFMDQLRSYMDAGDHPRAMGIAKTYADKDLNDLVAKAIKKSQASDEPGPQRAAVSRDPVYADDSPSRDKGSVGANEPIPSRPDRAGVQVRGAAPKPAPSPTDPNFHDVGLSQHQYQVQNQPSIQGGERSFKTTSGDRKVGSVPNPVPKAPETHQLDRLHALLKNDDEITRIARRQMSRPDGSMIPGMELAPTKEKIKAKIKAKIAELGALGKSTIQTKTGLEPNKFFRQGGSVKDIEAQGDSTWDPKTKSFIKTGDEPKADPGQAKGGVGSPKPKFDGTVIGQKWAPNAYTTDFGDFDKEGNFVRDPKAQGGMGFKKGQYANQAIGGMGSMQRAPNPTKYDPKWFASHGWMWAGKENGGWLRPSQFAALVGSGRIKRKERDPSAPDLSKARVVSPVNPPSSRANLDNTTGRPMKGPEHVPNREKMPPRKKDD